VGKRTRTFEDNLQEIIRRSINNTEIKGTEKLKWVLAGIKIVHLQKISGTAEHGTGFDTIDQDDDPDDLTNELDEQGARDEHDANGSGGAPAA
jgi:hypothetical protein